MQLEQIDSSYKWRSVGEYFDKGATGAEIRNYSECIAPSEAQTLKIGGLLPLSGALASTGSISKKAMELAVVHWNQWAKARKIGVNISLSIKDTATSSDQAGEQLNALLDEGNKLIIGPYSSSCLETVGAMTALFQVPVISPGSTSSSMAVSDHVLRLLPDDRHQVNALSAMIADRGFDKVNLVYRNDNYGFNFYTLLQNQYSELSSIAYNSINNEFDSVIAFLEQQKTANPNKNQLTIVAGFSELDAFLKALAGNRTLQGMTFVLSEGFGRNKQIFAEKNLLSGLNNFQIYSIEPNVNAMGFHLPQSYVFQYALSLSEVPSLIVFNSYDVIWLAGLCAARAGVSSVNVANLKKEANYTHGMGLAMFLDENGARSTAYYGFYKLDPKSSSWELDSNWNNSGFSTSGYHRVASN
jgi:branched-chain amino acid transport system substrate-binding protein